MRNLSGQITCYAVQQWVSMSSQKKDADWYNMAMWAVLGRVENENSTLRRNIHTAAMQNLLRKYDESQTHTYMRWGHRGTVDEKLARKVLSYARRDKPKEKWRLIQMDIAVFVKEVA